MKQISNILLIEDNPDVVRLFENIIDKSGSSRYAVSHATNLKAVAENMPKSVQNQYVDVVVLNLSPANPSGLDTLHACKDLFPKVPIIALLERDEEHLATQVIRSGARSFLTKSALNSQLVLQKIDDAIERSALWSKMVEADKREHYLVTRDSLTGLPNRHSVMETIQHLVPQSERRKEEFAVVFIDVDRFKAITELVGQIVGDAILLEVAKRLQSCVRETDVVARLSKSEFVLILSNLQSQHDAARVCNKVLKHFSAPVKYHEKKLNIACNMGIALYPHDATDFDTLMNHADAALQFAKMSGRNSYKFFTRDLTNEMKAELDLEKNLATAIERGALKLVYQPIYHAGGQSLSGVEALVRWPQKDGSILSPEDFIPVAEKSGLSVALGEYILREACKQARAWFDAGYSPVSLSVNISDNFFKQNQFADKIDVILQETGYDPQYLTLELMEHAVMKDAQSAKHTLEELRSLGVRVSIDDFGTGYSSLSCLNNMSIDTLKIDKSIIQQSDKGKKDLALVEAIVSLAKHLKLNIIAEGVETAQQRNTMENLGCDQLQGFHFNRPMEANEIELLYG